MTGLLIDLLVELMNALKHGHGNAFEPITVFELFINLHIPELHDLPAESEWSHDVKQQYGRYFTSPPCFLVRGENQCEDML